MTLLQDLANAKAVFQCRAVCAALGIMGEASKEGARLGLPDDAMMHPSPTKPVKGERK